MSESPQPTIHGYPVRVRLFEIAGTTLELLGPDNYEELIDDPRVAERFARDEFLPYWAEFWPACLLLANEVARWPRASGPPAAHRVLELGCGLGLPSLVAASLGYSVIASDYDDDALAFVAASFARNGLAQPELRYLDWRCRYPDLVLDRIIAAEVLYEARSVEPIAQFLAAHLAPDGFAQILDGNRRIADALPRAAEAAGLIVEKTPQTLNQPGFERPVEGRLFTLRRQT